VREFLKMSEKGDAIIFCGLSKTALTYYLRRSGRLEAFSCYAYPKELEIHPGWGTSGWFMRDTLKLLSDAQAIKRDLLGLRDKSIWVFWKDEVVTSFLFSELKGDFSQIRLVDLGRNCFFRYLSQFKQKGRHG